MLSAIILSFKKVFGKKSNCTLPSKEECPFSHRFSNIDGELVRIGNTLGELQSTISKLLNR
jgi:hypothetical protein